MAIINNTTPITQSWNQPLVFRKESRETLITATTVKQPRLEHFQQAVLYLYANGEPTKPAGSTNAYNIAVADFFSAPNIKEVDLSDYKGVVSNPIRIQVTNDFKVRFVTVEIYNDAGTLIEQGDAVRQPNNLDWVYTAQVPNPGMSGDKITIKATDLPGHPITLVVSAPFE